MSLTILKMDLENADPRVVSSKTGAKYGKDHKSVIKHTLKWIGSKHGSCI